MFFSGGRGLNEKAILVVGVFMQKINSGGGGGVNIKTILVVVGLCKKSILRDPQKYSGTLKIA